MPSASSVVVDVGDVPVALTTSDAALAGDARTAVSPLPESSRDTGLPVRHHRRARREVWTPTPTWRYSASTVSGTCGAETFRPSGTRTPGTARSGRRCPRTPSIPCCGSSTRCCCRDEQGFLLHASSVVRDGRAFLFTGPSGAGKTTIVRHAPDGRDGPDRRNLLRAAAGETATSHSGHRSPVNGRMSASRSPHRLPRSSGSRAVRSRPARRSTARPPCGR